MCLEERGPLQGAGGLSEGRGNGASGSLVFVRVSGRRVCVCLTRKGVNSLRAGAAPELKRAEAPGVTMCQEASRLFCAEAWAPGLC
jgi:hypothetical protein